MRPAAGGIVTDTYCETAFIAPFQRTKTAVEAADRLALSLPDSRSPSGLSFVDKVVATLRLACPPISHLSQVALYSQ